MPGSANDVRALNALPLNLPAGSEIYGDSAYTDYTIEDDLEYIAVQNDYSLSIKISV